MVSGVVPLANRKKGRPKRKQGLEYKVKALIE